MSYQEFTHDPSFQRDLHTSVERQSRALGLSREMTRRKEAVAAGRVRRHEAAVSNWESEGGAVASAPSTTLLRAALPIRAPINWAIYAALTLAALLAFRLLSAK